MAIQPKEIQVVDNQHDKLEINDDGSTNNRIVDSLSGVWELDPNDAMPVNTRTKHSAPIDALFAASISNFTLSADTTAATPTTVPKSFTATAGHGIVLADEILLLDIAQNRNFYANVTNVAGDDITVDKPLDESYSAVSTLGRIVTTQMAVDGSVTPRIFTARAGSVDLDITRTILTILDATAMDDAKFGGIPALTNGLAFRILNGFKLTMFNFHSNQDIKQFCYDLNYSDKAPAGFYGMASRISFGGEDKHDTVLRIMSADYLQWVVQDDLTGLDSLISSLMGRENLYG